MLRKTTALLTSLFLAFSISYAQQKADQAIEIKVENPTFTSDGPVIAIDGGHNNFHKLDGRFKPFGDLMAADGYQVRAIQNMTLSNLEKIDILVISNPLNEVNLGNWKNPCPSAFTEEEIKTLKRWVKNGGNLLLIADHMPFGGAAQELGKAFGFEFANGFAMAERGNWPPDTFLKSDGTIKEHEITQNIPQLAGFTGSAIKAPKKAIVLTRFSEKHQVLLPEIAWQFQDDTPKESGSDYIHGAILEFGKGKLAVFSEAAMFTAQIANNGRTKVGFNAEAAPNNQAFILNLMHWLDGQ